MDSLQVVLGKPRLNKYNPDIDWPSNSMVVKTSKQEHYLVGGPKRTRCKDPLSLSFISGKQVKQAVKNGEEVYLCIIKEENQSAVTPRSRVHP